MTRPRQLLVFALLAPLSAAHAADGVAPPDMSQWKCESCPTEQGASGSATAGIGYVTDDSAKFGEYTGLNKKGAYFVGDGEARYRGPDATYLNADVTDIGLDSRFIGLEGGRQGQYRLRLDYDEIPHFTSDTARTPYLGTGSNGLTLPPGFPAASTAQMPLATTLQDVDLDTKRKAIGFSGTWTGMPGWEYSVGVRHEKKEGTQRTAGAFFTNAAQLVEPVDYTTDQIDASIAYLGARWQAKLSYYGSIFNNDNTSLTFQNAFTFPPNTSGQLALPPGNEFHQVRASGTYLFTPGTRATADIAWGRMTQNEGFLAPTINPAITTGALPGSSLDARAKTLDANAKVVSQLTEQLTANASYARHERDNDTSQAVYPWVTTDTFLATPRVNLPYDFKQDKGKVSVDYRHSALIKASVGYDYDRTERTNQEVDSTREQTVWGRIGSKPLDIIDGWIKFAHAERDNSGYHAVPSVVPLENPLMRKYNLADRDRDSAQLRADIAAAANLSIGVGAGWAHDSYTNSTIGLTSGNEFTLDADIALAVTELTTVHVFGSYQEIKSRQVGSQNFSTPDWAANNRDRVDFFGIGARHAVIKDQLDIGADYRRVYTRSLIEVDTGITSRFPDIATSIDTLRLYATYRLNPKLRINADWWYESYRSADWHLDNVVPNTIPNVLTFGEQSPRYNVNVFRVSATYDF
jgi:MtrB/PioB family decaheme-associated outer membrane protein